MQEILEQVTMGRKRPRRQRDFFWRDYHILYVYTVYILTVIMHKSSKIQLDTIGNFNKESLNMRMGTRCHSNTYLAQRKSFDR